MPRRLPLGVPEDAVAYGHAFHTYILMSPDGSLLVCVMYFFVSIDRTARAGMLPRRDRQQSELPPNLEARSSPATRK